MINPRCHPLVWGYPGAIKCKIDVFGAKMGPRKELKKAKISHGGVILSY